MKLLRKILVFLLSVVILSFSVGSSYYGASRVNAAEWVIGGSVGAEAVLDFLLAFWASLGVGKVAYDNRSELWDSYCDYMDVKIQNNELSISSTQDAALHLYDSATDSVKSIPWQDLLDSFSEGFDSVIDGAYDLYACYCPELIGLTRDYVSDVVNGDLFVNGISSSIVSISNVTSSEIAKQWSGEGYKYMCDITYYWDYYSRWNNVKAYTTFDPPGLGFTASYPVALAYYSNGKGSGYVLDILNVNSNSYVGGGGLLFSTFDDGELTSNRYYINKNYSSITSSKPISVATNIPIFGSKEAAEAYLRGEIEASEAINYASDIPDLLGDVNPNDDLPFWENYAGDLYGNFVSSDVISSPWGLSWASDLPFFDLDDLLDYDKYISDVIDRILDQLLSGELDLPSDIPYTYEDLWDDAVSDAWDQVIDDSLPGVVDPVNPDVVIPVEKPVVVDPSKPVEGEDDEPIEGGGDSGGGRDEPSDKWVVDLSKFFPFCIPFDLVYLLDVLDAEPQAPRFEIPLKLPAYGIDYTFVIDLSDFESVAAVFRTFETILFILGLILLTRELIQG